MTGLSPEPPGAPLAGQSFLLIEDDVFALEFLERLIVGWGAHACSAACILEARERLDGMRPRTVSFVIADMQLGAGESGLDAILMSRAHMDRPGLPAILLTGNVSRALRESASLHSVVVVEKPLRPIRLLAEIRSLLK